MVRVTDAHRNVQGRRRKWRHGELPNLQPSGMERRVAWEEMERRGRASYRRIEGRVSRPLMARIGRSPVISAGDFASEIWGRREGKVTWCVGADVGIPHVSDRKEKERSARAGLLLGGLSWAVCFVRVGRKREG